MKEALQGRKKWRGERFAGLWGGLKKRGGAVSDRNLENRGARGSPKQLGKREKKQQLRNEKSGGGQLFFGKGLLSVKKEKSLHRQNGHQQRRPSEALREKK